MKWWVSGFLLNFFFKQIIDDPTPLYRIFPTLSNDSCFIYVGVFTGKQWSWIQNSNSFLLYLLKLPSHLPFYILQYCLTIASHFPFCCFLLSTHYYLLIRITQDKKSFKRIFYSFYAVSYDFMDLACQL